MKLALSLAVLGFWACPLGHGETPDLTYYKQIVAKSAGGSEPEELRKLELAALENPETVENYYSLAKAFAKTSERVWAVVYGEIYCSHASDPKRFLELSALLGATYESSLIYKNDKEAGVSFMKVAEVGPGSAEVPFEMNFEISTITGFDDYSRYRNLSIKTIHEIRVGQLGVWKEKKLPEHGFINWLQQMSDAGMLEAYDFWLLQKFRPTEYAVWSAKNAGKLKEFLAWRESHKFDLSKKNFHRLH